MSNGFGLIIESLVAVLLVITIGYCVLLNRRLKRFKSDEQALKATISELLTATSIAERAIGGLKLTVRECDQEFGDRLRSAEAFSAEIARQIEAGQEVVNRLVQITLASRPNGGAPTVASIAPDAQSTVAAAQAFAARSRLRAHGAAA